MSERFYSATPITAERVTLDGPEAHHLLHVMRAKVGEQVTLFDGSSDEFTAEVVKLSRATAELQILERRILDRELPFELIVAVALPKGDRQKWLVEKLTELGVTTLVPIETARGVAQPTAGTLDRLRRSVIEAAKQCGRNRLMQIAEPKSWSNLIASDPRSPEPSPQRRPHRRLVAHPGGKPLTQFNLATPTATQLAICPEGGLTDEEINAALAAGWQTVDLGPRILRVETAAVALAAAISLSAGRNRNRAT